jgi:hypothetical protein
MFLKTPKGCRETHCPPFRSQAPNLFVTIRSTNSHSAVSLAPRDHDQTDRFTGQLHFTCLSRIHLSRAWALYFHSAVAPPINHVLVKDKSPRRFQFLPKASYNTKHQNYLFVDTCSTGSDEYLSQSNRGHGSSSRLARRFIYHKRKPSKQAKPSMTTLQISHALWTMENTSAAPATA